MRPSGLEIHICRFSDGERILLASNPGLHCFCACHCLLELLARLCQWHRAFQNEWHHQTNSCGSGYHAPCAPHSWESSSATTSSPQKALPNTQSSLSIENSVLGTVLSAETRAGLKREGEIRQSIWSGRHGHGTLLQEACPRRSPSGWHAGNRRAVITGKNQVMGNRTRDRTGWHWDF